MEVSQAKACATMCCYQEEEVAQTLVCVRKSEALDHLTYWSTDAIFLTSSLMEQRCSSRLGSTAPCPSRPGVMGVLLCSPTANWSELPWDRPG